MQRVHLRHIRIRSLLILRICRIEERAQRIDISLLARSYRARGLLRKARASAISSAPSFSPAASGRPHSSWHCVIATPQCAIAHPGSSFAIVSNCRCASAYPNECSSATPRLYPSRDPAAPAKSETKPFPAFNRLRMIVMARPPHTRRRRPVLRQSRSHHHSSKYKVKPYPAHTTNRSHLNKPIPFINR